MLTQKSEAEGNNNTNELKATTQSMMLMPLVDNYKNMTLLIIRCSRCKPEITELLPTTQPMILTPLFDNHKNVKVPTIQC